MCVIPSLLLHHSHASSPQFHLPGAILGYQKKVGIHSSESMLKLPHGNLEGISCSGNYLTLMSISEIFFRDIALVFFETRELVKAEGSAPRKLTWIPKMMVWKRWFLLNAAILCIYIKFLMVSQHFAWLSYPKRTLAALATVRSRCFGPAVAPLNQWNVCHVASH